MVFLALVVFSAAGFLALPKSVSATVYDPNQVTFHLDTYMPDGNGGIKTTPDNLLQLGKDTIYNIAIQAGVTITAPPSGLQFGTDTFDMNIADTEANAEKSGGLTLNGFGAGVDKMKVAGNASAGGASCTSSSIWVFSKKSNQQYISCSFVEVGGGADITSTIPAGQSQKMNIPLNQNDLIALGLNPSNTTTLQSFIIYPFITFTRAFSTRQMVFPAGGFAVYVQFYDTQAAANAAIISNQRPSGVPGYSGTTSSGQSGDSGGLFDLVTSVIVFIASVINQLIYFLFYWLVAPLIQAVLSIHVYTDAFIGVIYPGWEIVRNVCNILFIVAIIAMGMATLLRVESYQWRHLLVQLVIAALLVNFSLIIGQAILALADTIQSQFLPNNVDVIRSLAQNLMVANKSTQLAQNSFGGQVSYIIQYLFFVAMAIGSFIVFAAIACFLVLRMVVLWVLLMLSPVAYVARILPATQAAAKKWWDEFIKYAFFTPIIAFFLNLTAVIAASFTKNPVLQQIQGANGAFAGSTLPGVSSFIFIVGSNIMLLVFLILAIKVANWMGVAGGGILSDIGEKGMKWPFTYTGNKIKEKSQAAGMYVDRNTRLKLADKLAPKDSDTGLQRFGKSLGFGVLAPGAQGAAKKEAREHKYKEAKEMLAAHATDLVDPKARAAEKLKLQRENEKVKKAHDTYANASEAQVVTALNNAINKGDIVEFKALMKVATEENYMGAVALGVGGGDINDVYRKMDGKMKSTDDKNKVDQTRKQVDKNEADKGRYQHMSNIPTTGPGTGARDQKLNSLSIEDMAKVDKDLYMTGGVALTGTATTVLKDIVTAMASNPDVARDMIKQLKKKEKIALRTLLGARGAPVTVPAGVNALDAAAAKGHFDTYVP